MKIKTKLAALFLSGYIFTAILFGQAAKTNITSDNATGLASTQTFEGSRENIDLSTGNLDLQIPLLNLPGRHGANLSVTLAYDSKPLGSLSATWDPDNGIATYLFGPPGNPAGLPGGWRLNIPSLQTNIHTVSGPPGYNSACYQNFIVTTADGSSHTFANMAGCATTQTNSPFTVTANPSANVPVSSAYDSPDLLLDTSNSADIVLRGKDGTSFHFFANLPLALANPQWPDGDPIYKIADQIVDANGNTLTITVNNSNGSMVLTDTLGRTVTLASSGGASAPIDSISYLDSSGTKRTITLGYSNISPSYTFSLPSVAANAPLTVSGTQSALTLVTLPNGLTYQFAYNTALGELSKITYPTGGYTRYDYETFTHYWQAQDALSIDAAAPADYREVTAKHVCRDPQGACTTATEDTTTYSPTVDGTLTNNKCMDVTDALGNLTHYQFTALVHSGVSGRLQNPGNPFQSRELLRKAYQGSATLLVTTQTDYNNLDGNGNPTSTSLPIRVTTTLHDSNQVSNVEYDYDTDVYDNVIAERRYDFGIGTPGALVRRTAISWLKTNSVNNVNYLGASVHILNRKASDAAYDSVNNTCQGQNNPCAQTTYEYDNYTTGLSASGAVQHSTAFGTGNTVRGNITTANGYRNTDNTTLTTRSQYDDAGNILSVTDPAGNKTSFSYADSWSDTTCTPSGGNAAAYATSTTNAKLQKSTSTYNSCTGTLASSTDINSQTTNFSYDAINRLIQTTLPADSSGQHPQTSVAFNESSLPLSVTTTKKITSSSSVASTITLDGLGRTVKSTLDSDPLGLIVDTTYDALGRKTTESNPHRTATGGATDGITSFSWDALGRPTQVTRPDGAVATTSYFGSATRVTDEGNGTRGVQRISQTDGLGRLVSLCEVSNGPFVGGGGTSSTSMVGQGGTPADCGLLITAKGFLTTYTYDSLGHLTGVSQGGAMQRSFTYDSLSHLVKAVNPESGTTNYTYDANGNLSTKTDARNITTTYIYDGLNRLTNKAYASGSTPDPLTPPVTLTYDVCPSTGCPSGVDTHFLAGRLVSASTSGATSFNSYDALGRTVNQLQCTPVNCATGYFNLAYSYNVGGNLLSETNGFGVTLNYAYDSVDRLQSVTSSLTDTNHPGTLLSSLQYGPVGLTAETLGNGATESITYSNRGQLQNLSVGGITITNHPAVAGSGSVTLGGSENSTTPPATKAQGTIIIDGSEQSDCAIPSPTGFGCSEFEYDSGTVSITVGSFTVSSNFSQLLHNNASSLATDLTNKLNGSGSPVTATLSDTTITLTSIASGASANLGLSASVTSSLQSFSATPSGANLTGGGGGVTVFDAGSVTVTVNGTAYTASYGNGSTASAIALALASTLSAGTLVNASASGNVIALTAKSAGASSNYSLSASSATSQPQGLFSGPSFTASASGSALTGGANAFTTTQGATIYSLSMGYAPNGDVLSANDSVNGNWAYSYDDFNHVTGANQNSGQQVYNYVYDRFGNRWQQNAPQGGNVQLLTFNTSNNNRIDGYSYDASGNLLSDGSSTFTYDAEGRIVKAVKSGVTTTYVYDAGGRRVRKTVAGVTTDYVYNLGGAAVAEVSNSGTWTRGEVFAGGKHLATYAGGATGAIYFNHTDWLGTERVRSDKNGAACETITSLLFGDGMTVSGSCGDPSTRHFTGKEHDGETGLDDFGARYYSSQLGRFVSADWSDVPVPVPYANFTNPQTLNLYTLVQDNPATFADLDGHLAPGQLGSAEGLAVQPRTFQVDSAAACLPFCDNAITTWELTLNGVGTGIFFDSQVAGSAFIAQNFPQQQTQQSASTNTGVPVVLPNGSNVPDTHSRTGVLISPVADLSPVAAAGDQTGQRYLTILVALGEPAANAYLIASLGNNVGTGGKFDYQRSGNFITGFEQRPQFRDVSNFNVGLFTQKAGLTLVETLDIAGKFAAKFSSNASPGQPFGLNPRTAEFIIRGYIAGASFY